MREAWVQVDRLQDEILSLKTNHPPPNDKHLQGYRSDIITREADLALQEAEVARQQLEKTRRRGSTPLSRRRRYQSSPEDTPDTIKENTIIEGIGNDRESIRRSPPTQQDNDNLDVTFNERKEYDENDTMEMAEKVKRQSKPPSTDEVFNDENSDIPYDPNLTCPGCGQRYRYGEIQKLRRHVNEFCPVRDIAQRQF